MMILRFKQKILLRTKGITMKKVFLIGSALIGIIVGAGFASGQEILQYFTSFGKLGIFAAIVSTMLFSYIRKFKK